MSVFRTAARVAVALLVVSALITAPQFLSAQNVPVIERPMPFDSAGRVMVLTPAAVSRLAIATGALPMSGEYRESRLFQDGSGAMVLVVQLLNGSVERYPISTVALVAIRRAITDGLVAQEARGARDRAGGAGVDISEPASNVFTRNQTLLGVFVYGPAMSAMVSSSGGAASGGAYLLTAGSSFFIAANLGKHHPITRAQASLSGHMGVRGALYGLAGATVARADGGAQVGTPILLGAVAGSIVGYHRARPMSDGEAATSALGADMAALTTLGVSGAAGAFKRRNVVRHVDNPYGNGQGYDYVEQEPFPTKGRIALVGAVAAGVVGYAVGPNYARRAKYNVTDGDVDVVFTSALLGGLATTALVSEDSDEQTAIGVATAGLITGAVLGDRFMARRKDRTGSEGTLVQLGAFAGGLMGAGVAAMTESGQRFTIGLVASGGLLGMLAAEGILKPAPDAGPLRGVLPRSARDAASRVDVNLGSLVTALVLREKRSAQNSAKQLTAQKFPLRASAQTPNATALPLVRISW